MMQDDDMPLQASAVLRVPDLVLHRDEEPLDCGYAPQVGVAECLKDVYPSLSSPPKTSCENRSVARCTLHAPGLHSNKHDFANSDHD